MNAANAMAHISKAMAIVVICLTVVGCQTGTLSTPEDALSYYIESLRQGSLDGVLEVLYEEKSFQLPEPIPIDSIKIEAREALTAERAKEYEYTPSPLEGDVMMDVRQYIGGRSYMYSYNFRKRGRQWYLHSWSWWDFEADIEDEM